VLNGNAEHNGPQDEHGVTYITWARGPDSTWFTRPSSCSLQSRTARDSVAPYWPAGGGGVTEVLPPHLGERNITNRAWFGDEYCRDNDLIPGMILKSQDIIKKKDE
jgi:hypothetical protein